VHCLRGAQSKRSVPRTWAFGLIDGARSNKRQHHVFIVVIDEDISVEMQHQVLAVVGFTCYVLFQAAYDINLNQSLSACVPSL